MIYRHESMLPFDSLDSEDGLRRHLYLLRSFYIKTRAYGRVVRDPVTRKEYNERDFLLAALKGTRFAVISKSDEKASEEGGVLLHTGDLAKAVGKWDEDIKKQSDTCKNLKTDEPRHSEIVCKPCPGIDYVCSCAELCQEKGLHYQNKRFGAENPKPLTEIVDDVLAKDQ